uniref:Uncharacterized protein n=1 Tax=Siphoviridae sp. ctfZQ2 TaxID=2826415 RepID=A0A8S5NC52_9CAUD|nr:MAG TPA: hypothetical protein [Siphoviridae sp. ctfZQ2]
MTISVVEAFIFPLYGYRFGLISSFLPKFY